MRAFTPGYAELGYEKLGYCDEYFSLIVWRRMDSGDWERIELTHSILNEPHALVWEEKGRRVAYHSVEGGELKPGRTPSALLVANGGVPKDRIRAQFQKRRKGVPDDLADEIEGLLEAI